MYDWIWITALTICCVLLIVCFALSLTEIIGEKQSQKKKTDEEKLVELIDSRVDLKLIDLNEKVNKLTEKENKKNVKTKRCSR